MRLGEPRRDPDPRPDGRRARRRRAVGGGPLAFTRAADPLDPLRSPGRDAGRQPDQPRLRRLASRSWPGTPASDARRRPAVPDAHRARRGGAARGGHAGSAGGSPSATRSCPSRSRMPAARSRPRIRTPATRSRHAADDHRLPRSARGQARRLRRARRCRAAGTGAPRRRGEVLDYPTRPAFFVPGGGSTRPSKLPHLARTGATRIAAITPILMTPPTAIPV